MRQAVHLIFLMATLGCISAEIPEGLESNKNVDVKERNTASNSQLSLWNTYYYVPVEQTQTSGPRTTLYNANCEPIAEVPASFSDSACIEGTGRLKDGRVVNYASVCQCGRRCPYGRQPIICWSELNDDRFFWGKGARNNPLVPMRSIAVDRNVIALGTTLYIPQWNGVQLPSMDSFEGFVHDGCFRADDVGSAIDGTHIDIFTGPESLYRLLNRRIPSRTTMQAEPGDERCAYLLTTTTSSPRASVPQGSWLGSPCQDHAECAGVNGPNSGYCHKDSRVPSSVGVCTASCAGTCPDRDGSASTFCIDATELGGSDGGYCVSRAESENQWCGQLPSFVSSTQERYVGTSGVSTRTHDVCLPQGSASLNANRTPDTSPSTDEPSTAQPEPSEQPPSRAVPVDEPCGSIDYFGHCRGSVVEWCEEGTLSRIDCESRNEVCGYVSAEIGYFCIGSAVSTESDPLHLCDDPSLSLSDHGEACPGVPENTWRCACSERYSTTISQVCRGGYWTTLDTNPRDCSRCNGTYTSGCEGQ